LRCAFGEIADRNGKVIFPVGKARRPKRWAATWHPVRSYSMKSLVSTIVALGLAVALTAPAFAGPGSLPNNKKDCEAAGKVWDEANKKCLEKQ
jgi:hypothetical protein